MKGYVYILLCSDGSYYTGSTNNLELRLQQHFSGEGSNYTQKHRPIKLLYFEEFSEMAEAFYREKQIQGWSRKKKEALIKEKFEKLPDLSKNKNELAGTSTSSVTAISGTESSPSADSVTEKF
jgi:putative endonuclease